MKNDVTKLDLDQLHTVTGGYTVNQQRWINDRNKSFNNVRNQLVTDRLTRDEARGLLRDFYPNDQRR